MRTRAVLLAALLGVLAAGPEATAEPLTPHSVTWERYFTVSWEPFERRGRPCLRGYIVSRYGAVATRVQLLVDSLDPAGQILAQRVEWLGGTVPGFSRTYFEVPVRQPGSSYRVRVFAFDFFQARRFESP